MENKTLEQLWEEFRIGNPNTVGGFQEQYESFILNTKLANYVQHKEQTTRRGDSQTSRPNRRTQDTDKTPRRIDSSAKGGLLDTE